MSARDWRDVAYPTLAVVVALAAWQAASMAGWLRPIQFPPPTRLAQSFVELMSEGYPEGIALGLDAGPVFDKTISEKAIQLDKGDRVVLYTDGAINGRNPAGAQYGDERFYYVVNREAPKNSAACVNFVANDVDLFHEGAPLMDDFTIVTLRRLK